MTPLLVGLAGGLGAVSRFVLDNAVARLIRFPFPFGTLVINVTGSFLLGLLTAWTTRTGALPELGTILGSGFLGGFTTFSTASMELVRLSRAGSPAKALFLASAMLVVSVLAAAAGLLIGRV